MMKDPVILLDSGHSFERKSLTEWLEKNATNPVTGAPLRDRRFQTNNCLRGAIQDFVKFVEVPPAAPVRTE